MIFFFNLFIWVHQLLNDVHAFMAVFQLIKEVLTEIGMMNDINNQLLHCEGSSLKQVAHRPSQDCFYILLTAEAYLLDGVKQHNSDDHDHHLHLFLCHPVELDLWEDVAPHDELQFALDVIALIKFVLMLQQFNNAPINANVYVNFIQVQ